MADPGATPRLVVVTGGPGAGKTALLAVAQRRFGAEVSVIPEAAGILFGGGFPRRPTDPGRRAAQRAIFAVQRQLERLATEEARTPIVLCDRGTVDGLAYWPGDAASFWSDVGSTEAIELGRYAAVIHLRTPPPADGYNHANPVRVETAAEAHRIDERIVEAWAHHPRRHVIEESPVFLDKVVRGLAALGEEVRMRPGGGMKTAGSQGGA